MAPDFVSGTMTSPYFPFQLEGAAFLSERRTALLSDEMGLGKSVQAVLAAMEVAPLGPWLIVCPAIVREHWRREINQWASVPPPTKVVLSSREAPTPAMGWGVTICSYEYATARVEALAALPWEVLILDEAHAVKNRGAKRTKALLGKLSQATKRLWFLTGTPAPNHPGEMYCYAAAAGATDMDEELFCSTYTYGAWSGDRWQALATREDRMPELRATLAPMMLRRTKAEVMKELPAISRHLVPLELPRPDLSALGSRIQELRSQLADEAGHVRSFLLQLEELDGAYETLAGVAQAVPTLRRYLALLKVRPALAYLQDEIQSSRKKLVLFVAHTEAGEWYADALGRLTAGGCVWVYGGTTPKRRQEHIDRFNSDPHCRVFLGNVMACGAGINLAHSGCSEVVHLDREWTPMWGEQGEARIHRPPQVLPVTVRDVFFPDTLDEAIMRVLSRKRSMISSIWRKDVALFS